ncbi:hypothetical protein SAMN04487947_1757 [Halogeometricum rufum]|jgi:hypothetical protein|uniref:DUF7511 domain-containing protein n=1 Tax=Halogeometricum rufum TaxID=553469 RepID=A0A1I6GWQ9_9EURY|nr:MULTISPECIES: hypothetical protein [Halogeometricum]MUV56434.1 hypothetical protein [Halogeometricum sp. CBA1124]SFR46618.1 hypothetical protein SAMN04487947_1757 [Halogeometricum rufum]
MSDSPASSQGPSEPWATTDAAASTFREIDGRDYELHSVVVQYDGEPDRCTVYPRRDRCLDRMAAWLSADLDAFVGLEEMR